MDKYRLQKAFLVQPRTEPLEIIGIKIMKASPHESEEDGGLVFEVWDKHVASDGVKESEKHYYKIPKEDEWGKDFLIVGLSELIRCSDTDELFENQ